MPTYAYQLNFFEGASHGYVKYNISPDFGTPIAPGEPVTITGQMYNNEFKTKYFYVGTSAPGENRTYGFSKTVSKGSTSTFTMTFPMWTLSNGWGQNRVKDANIYFGFEDSGGNGAETNTATAQKITYLSYRISPVITKAEFERYMLSGSTYVPNDEGTKLVGDLSLSLASGYGVGDITIASVSVVDDSDSPQTQTVSISSAVLTSALSSGGYTETSPGLFSSLTFNTAYNYTLTFSIGDAYDTATAEVLVSRAFANVHLSGAENGGVAFGKFSSATDNSPLFECVYPAQFSGAVSFTSNAAKLSICNAIYPVGSIMIRADSTDPATLFPGSTWEQIKDRFLLAKGDTYTTVGNTGGNASVALPSHTHSIVGNSVYYANTASSSAANRLLQTTSGPSSATIATMPPYIIVYVWKRTA